MSLYNFFESFVKTNPDLLLINYTNTMNYDNLYDHYRSKEKRFEIESFLGPMFFDSIARCSATIQEFEKLKEKLQLISQVSQKLFTLTLLNDKIEKEKHCSLIEEKVSQYNL